MDATTRLMRHWGALAGRMEWHDSQWLLHDLLERYAEPQRCFHTAQHLADVVGWLEEERADDALIIAAWFHDAVYQPGDPRNESRSASLARSQLGLLGVDAQMLRTTVDAIMATTTHVPIQSRFAPLLDADLSILGAASADYARYREAIRCEFGGVPRFLYRRGRMAFLSAFLARPRLFHTTRGIERCEKSARRNLDAELRELRGSVSDCG